METKLFEIIIMTFDKTKVANKDFYSAKKSKDLGCWWYSCLKINWN